MIGSAQNTPVTLSATNMIQNQKSSRNLQVTCVFLRFKQSALHYSGLLMVMAIFHFALVANRFGLRPPSWNVFYEGTSGQYWIWTLVAKIGFWTLEANIGFWTLGANIGLRTPVTYFRFWTLMADHPFWTLVVRQWDEWFANLDNSINQATRPEVYHTQSESV